MWLSTFAGFLVWKQSEVYEDGPITPRVVSYKPAKEKGNLPWIRQPTGTEPDDDTTACVVYIWRQREQAQTHTELASPDGQHGLLPFACIRARRRRVHRQGLGAHRGDEGPECQSHRRETNTGQNSETELALVWDGPDRLGGRDGGWRCRWWGRRGRRSEGVWEAKCMELKPGAGRNTRATPRVTDRGSRAERRIGWPETGVSRPKLERCSQRTESNSSSPLPTQRFLECWVLGTVASRRRRPNPTSSPWAREEAWGDPATPATLQRATLLPMFARRDLAGRLAMPLWVPRWGQAARAAGRRSGRTAW